MTVLSPHQLQIVALLANGKTTKEIVLILQVKQRTVVNYLAKARRRMGAKTSVHLVALAVAQGMVGVDVENTSQGNILISDPVSL